MDVESDAALFLQVAHQSSHSQADHQIEGWSCNAACKGHLTKPILSDRKTGETVTQTVAPRKHCQAQQRCWQLCQNSEELQQVHDDLAKNGYPDHTHKEARQLEQTDYFERRGGRLVCQKSYADCNADTDEEACLLDCIKNVKL